MFYWFTDLEKEIVKNNLSIDTCLMFLLAWVEAQRTCPDYAHLQRFSAAYNYSGDMKILAGLAQTARLSDLQLCLEIVAGLAPADRAIVMKIVCAYVQGEAEINDARGYVIKFLADTLRISADELNSYLTAISNSRITTGLDPLGDDLARRKGIYRWEGKSFNAYDLLNVEPTASPEVIKAEYQKQVHACHPDRFATQGDKKIHEMAEQFKQLQAAYKHLSGS